MAHVTINEERRKPVRGYLLGVEWLYEFLDTLNIDLYPTVDDLYRNHPLSYFKGNKGVPQDGIVEVEVKFIRHIPAEKCFEEITNEPKREENC